LAAVADGFFWAAALLAVAGIADAAEAISSSASSLATYRGRNRRTKSSETTAAGWESTVCRNGAKAV
jgi:hypothetical protein